MRPRVSKARGTKVCVVAMTTFFSFSHEAASSAALQAINEDNVRLEFIKKSTTVTSHTESLPTCQGTEVKPSERFPSVRQKSTGSLTETILAL